MNQTKHFRNLYKQGVLVVMLAVGGIFSPLLVTTPAFADTPVVTATIGAGALAETASPTYAFSGTPGATVTFPLAFSVNDYRGSGVGWNVTLNYSVFTSTSPAATLPTTAMSEVTPTSAVCNGAGNCTGALANQGAAVTLPLQITAGTGIKIFSAAAGASAGAYTVTSTFSVVIPALQALSAAYTSSFILTAATGP